MYYTAKEIHIAIDTKLQLLSSNRKRKLHPEQIDILFNQNLLKYIEDNVIPERSLTKKPFYGDTNKLQNVQELVRNHPFNVPVNNAVVLPANVLFPVAVSLAYLPCAVGSVEKETETTYVSVLPFPFISNATSYDDFKITVTDSLGNVHTLFDNSVSNIHIKSVDGVFMILNGIFNSVNNEYELYWEKYNDLYNQNSIIIVTKKKSLTTTCSYGTVVNTYNFTKVDVDYYKTDDELHTKSAIVTFSGSKIGNNYYYQKAGLVSFDNNTLGVNMNNDKVIKIELSYVKRPVLLNYNTNTVPDLKYPLDEVINRTVSELIIILSGSVNQAQTILKDTE